MGELIGREMPVKCPLFDFSGKVGSVSMLQKSTQHAGSTCVKLIKLEDNRGE